MNNERNNGYPDVEFSFEHSSNDVENQERIAREKNQKQMNILKKLGYVFDENGNIDEKKTEENQKNIQDKLNGALVGFTVADAMGVPIEFTSRTSRKMNPLTEMVGYGSHKVPEGTWSDDSSMMLATMDSLMTKGNIDYDNIMSNYLDWIVNAEYTATDKVFDFGGATYNALKKYSNGTTSAVNSGGTGKYDNGNGSLMRFLPVALMLSGDEYSDEERYEIINNMSSLTHGHAISKMGCAIYSDYIKNLTDGYDKLTAYENVCSIDYSKYYSDSEIKEYSRILNGELTNLKEDEISSTGYVVDTLEASLWSVLTSNSYEESVVKAINLGEDTDTVGAITGGISGFVYGYDNIPKRWLDKMQKKEELINFCSSYSNWVKEKANVTIKSELDEMAIDDEKKTNQDDEFSIRM